MNSFQEQGRACYKRGDYRRAIAFFDRAVGHAPSVRVLDNRAACYEKLNELQAALKDAKKAIQLHREDATGYLRAGKILVKMEKDTVALEIYTHGLKSIKHVGQGYELLRSAQKDLMNKLSPPKSVDPMTLLPRELAETILEYLSFKQRMNACLVSKQWAHFIRSCPDLWRHLDLTHARRKVRNTFISRAINVGRNKLRRATLNSLYDFDKTLAAIVKHCPLEELSLLETGLLGDNLTEILRPAKHLKKLLMGSAMEFPHSELGRLLDALSEHIEQFECRITGPPIVNLTDSVFNKLHTLSITYSHDMDVSTALDPKLMPCLQSLTIRNEQSVLRPYEMILNLQDLPLRYLDLRLGVIAADCLQLPTSLVTLKLCNPMRLPGRFWFKPGPAGLEPVLFYLPFLEELELEIPQMIMHNVQYGLAGQYEQVGNSAEEALTLSKLRKLSIVGARLNYLQISEFFKHPRLGSLEVLRLPRLESCCDEDVNGIMDYSPKLHSLDLSETDITGIALRRVVQSGHLKDLTVNNCRKLGPDAVEWAREQGIRVQFRMTDGANGGRKVRE